MWQYEKKLQYPINIKNRNLKLANAILNQFGGPHGELSAALQYFSQRYTMPDARGYALLTDIATEELGHVEMITTMCKQLMKGATIEEIKAAGLEGKYANMNTAIYPSDSSGVPFTTAYISSTGDYIADLESDMAAEERARSTYEHLIDLTEDADVIAPLLFLRQREIIHLHRFKDLKEIYEKEYKK